MPDTVETLIPGRQPIELVAFYEEFRAYYPLCELETKRWFVEHIQPDWWILDVGANIGYYTILFSQLAPRGRVIAFEPTTTAAMLAANLKHNNVANAEVHEVALGAVTGERQDRVYRLWGSEGEVKVYPFFTLDDFIAQNRIERVDCIKIDVDSFDFEVLRGAERTLMERNPAVIVELNDALAKRNQHAGEALAWLAARGYRQARVLDHDNFVLQRGGDAFAGLKDATRLELLFAPPLRIDEEMPASAGTPVGMSVVKAAQLHNGSTAQPSETASTKAEASGLVQRLEAAWDRLVRRQDKGPAVAVDDLTHVTIATPPARWSYALTLELAPTEAGRLTVELGLEVISGRLGVAACAADISQLLPPEWELAAMPGRQRIVLKVAGPDPAQIVFRNVAPDGTATHFRVMSIEARQGALGRPVPA